MRICLVSSFPPSRERLNEYGYHLARELARDPVLSLTVLADELDSPQPELPEFDVIRCWRYNSLTSGRRLLETIRELKPDVVWFNLVFSTFGDEPLPAFAGLCLPLLTRLSGCYTHVTLHHLMESVNLEDAKVAHTALYRAAGVIATRMLLGANGVSVLLPAYRRTLMSKYRASNVHFRPHGIFASAPEFPDFALRNNPEQRILAFGKWGTYKRVEVLLEAFNEISRRCPAAKLIVAGSNHPLTPGYIEEHAARNAGRGNIEFTGYVPEHRIPELFSTASVVVMPYTSATGASGVAHQACQFGVPVISSDVPLFREMARDEEMAIDFCDISQAHTMAESITNLLRDEERQRQMAEQNFSVALRMSMPAVIRQYVRNFNRDQVLNEIRAFRRPTRMLGWSAWTKASKEGPAAVSALSKPPAIMGPITYSVIIPAYNEAARIGPTLQSVARYVESQRWRAEIIVVNDGSRDNTADVVRRYTRMHRSIRLVSYRDNRGKGHAVRTGMMNARGDFLLLCDADQSIPITESEKLFLALEQGADIAIGSRWLNTAWQVKKQPLRRRIAGRCFNLLVRGALRLEFADTQCGFKAFSSSAADLICRAQRVDRWAFDAELLFLAKKFGLNVSEVPIICFDDERSRIRLWHDSVHMIKDTLRVALGDYAGQYELQPRPAAVARFQMPLSEDEAEARAA